MKQSSSSLLARVRDGDRLDDQAALDIYLHAPIEELRAAATAVRDRFSAARRVSFLVDRNVNYTNVCITDCKFCEFYRPPGHAESYVLTRETLTGKLDELVALGGTRVLLQGGHNPELRLGWYIDLFRWMRTRWPGLQLDALSPSEIEHIAGLEGLPTTEVLNALATAGLGGIPGGGAEILEDSIRDVVSPRKTRTRDWLRIMGEAQDLELYTSASQVIGFGEEATHRLLALRAVREHQDERLAAGRTGFLAFVAWPLQFESRYGHVFGELKGWDLGADAEAYLRHIAFCRIYLDNIPHFQASWPTMGLATAARALQHGCDDMGGIMMEENVVSQAGSVHCSVTIEEVRGVIAGAGFEPWQRDSWYRMKDRAV